VRCLPGEFNCSHPAGPDKTEWMLLTAPLGLTCQVIVQRIPEQTACFSRLAPLFPYNVHYFPTTSTIPRHSPLFPYNVHYFQTCSTFSRQKGRIFTYSFLTSLRLQPSKTFHFLFWAPLLPPPRSELLPASPAALPLILQARPSAHKKEWYTISRQKGSFFFDNVHYFQTKRFIISQHSTLFPYNVHYFQTKKVHHFQT
jgi:hypothetical protein